MLLNESKFKDMRKGKERVTEKNWKYKIDKDLAFRLRDILEDDDTDYEALREVMKDIYDNIHRLIPDMFDEDECESAKEDLDILDTEEEDGFYDPDDEEYDFVDTLEDSWNYELSNLYDICDTFNIWIPIRTLDESVSGSSRNCAISSIASAIDNQLSDAKVEIVDGYVIRVVGGGKTSDSVIRDAVYRAADKFGFIPEFSRSGTAIDCRFKQPVRMYASYNRKKSGKKAIKESVASSSIRKKVYDIVYDIFMDAGDNLAHVVHSKVPEYDVDWCIESYNSDTANIFESFVKANVDDLFHYADELDEDTVYEEVLEFLEEHPYDKDSDAEEVAAEVLSNLYDLDYETCDGEISHAAYNAAEDYLDNLNESVKPKKLKESEEDQFCIVAITKEGKKVYYKEGKFVDDKAEATIFNDLDEARSEWFDIDKSKFKRVFVPKYEATKESYDKDGNHETCDNCGTLLTDAGECPKCDLGDEDANNKIGEGLFDKFKKKKKVPQKNEPEQVEVWYLYDGETGEPWKYFWEADEAKDFWRRLDRNRQIRYKSGRMMMDANKADEVVYA